MLAIVLSCRLLEIYLLDETRDNENEFAGLLLSLLRAVPCRICATSLTGIQEPKTPHRPAR
jgi:hypothetical protein